MSKLALVLSALAVSLMLATTGAQLAVADSSGPATWDFACTDASGAPLTFTAVHQQSEGSSFRLVDGTANFVAHIWYDLTAGHQFVPQGVSSNGNIELSCDVLNPYSGDSLHILGQMTPVS